MDIDLHACVSGDKAAWDAFVDRSAGIIVAAARRTIRGRGGAAGGLEIEDIVQEVFVRLVRDDFRLLRTFDGTRASLSTWLTIVARSTAIDRLRGKRLMTVELQADEWSERSGKATGGGAEHVGSVGQSGIPTHVLSERQRLVLRMLFDEDMSVREAAGVLGVDEQTVRSTKHKAIERLRAEMGLKEGTKEADGPRHAEGRGA